jgi:hypothetical protein
LKIDIKESSKFEDTRQIPDEREKRPFIFKMVSGKAIPATVREGPQGCETSRFPHFLDNRLTEVGEVAGLTRRPPFTPRKIPGTHFC